MSQLLHSVRVARLGAIAASMVSLVIVASPLTAQASGQSDDERGALVLASGTETRLSMGGYVQIDGRWLSGASTRAPDGMLIRRARLVFDASRADGWHLRLQPDFGQGRVLVQDAFAGYQRTGLSIRAGRFRPAFGVERMQSSSTLLSPERGLVNSLMPSRSFGLQVQREWRGWRMDVGGFRTPVGSDVTTVDTDGDVNAVAGIGHDLLARVSRSWIRDGRYAEVQSGVLAGREQGTVESPGLSRVLSVGQQPILSFVDDGTITGTAVANGARTRFTAGILAGTERTVAALEGAWLEQAVLRDGRTAQLRVAAASARAAHVVNGSRASNQEVSPRTRAGALEVGLRVGVLGAWGRDLEQILTRRSATHARMAGAAVSWLPNRTTRLTVGYDFTTRAAGLPREHALVGRWQQGF